MERIRNRKNSDSCDESDNIQDCAELPSISDSELLVDLKIAYD
jgi:hypothetical protein